MEKSSSRFTALTVLRTTKYHVLLRALDTTLATPVIIKTPRVEYLNDIAICNILAHEGAILERLGALPHVQQHIVHGVEQDGTHAIPYLATHEAAGTTLYDLVRDDAHHGRIAHREGLMMMRVIAQTLFPVHELGVIHCDLKLGNILWDSASSSCTVMDWAAALSLAEQHRTTNDPIIGTAQFMSYEHITGGEIDARTDIYALGIMMTLLIYGQELTPRYTLTRGEMVKRTKEETADAVARKETIKSEMFDLPQSSYDWGMQQLLKRMTHWDREMRPRSMEEIVQECERILQ